jgi:hypothetical protein
MSNLTMLTLEKHGREIGALLASIDSAAGLSHDAVLHVIQITCENAVYPRIEAKVLRCLETDAEDDEILCQRMDVLIRRPQAFFGIPTHLRSSRGYAKASSKLKFVETGSLPTAKIGALVETAHAIFEEVDILRSEVTAEVARLQRMQQETIYEDDELEDESNHHIRTSSGGTRAAVQNPELVQAKVMLACFENHDALTPEQFLSIFTFVIVQAELTQPLQIRSLLWTLCDPNFLKGERGYYATMYELALIYIAGNEVTVVDEEALVITRSFDPIFEDDEEEDEDEDRMSLSVQKGANQHQNNNHGGHRQNNKRFLSVGNETSSTHGLGGGGGLALGGPTMIGGSRLNTGFHHDDDDGLTKDELNEIMKTNVAILIVKPHLLEGAVEAETVLTFIKNILECFPPLKVTRQGLFTPKEMQVRQIIPESPHDANIAVPWLMIEFLEDEFSWAAFNFNVIGSPDPNVAIEGSIRKSLQASAGQFGLSSSSFDLVNNGIHATDGPLASWIERVNWLQDNVADQLRSLEVLFRKQGVNKVVRRWASNPFAAVEKLTASNALAASLSFSRQHLSGYESVNDSLAATPAVAAAQAAAQSSTSLSSNSSLAPSANNAIPPLKLMSQISISHGIGSSPQVKGCFTLPRMLLALENGGAGNSAFLSGLSLKKLYHETPATYKTSKKVIDNQPPPPPPQEVEVTPPEVVTQAAAAATTEQKDEGVVREEQGGGEIKSEVDPTSDPSSIENTKPELPPPSSSSNPSSASPINMAPYNLHGKLLITSQNVKHELKRHDALPWDQARQTVIPIELEDDALVGPGLIYGKALELTCGIDNSDFIKLASEVRSNFANIIVKSCAPKRDNQNTMEYDELTYFEQIESIVCEVLKSTPGLSVIQQSRILDDDSDDEGGEGDRDDNVSVDSHTSKQSNNRRGGSNSRSASLNQRSLSRNASMTSNQSGIDPNSPSSNNRHIGTIGTGVASSDDPYAPLVLTGQDVFAYSLFRTVHRVAIMRANTPASHQWSLARLDPTMALNMNLHPGSTLSSPTNGLSEPTTVSANIKQRPISAKDMKLEKEKLEAAEKLKQEQDSHARARDKKRREENAKYAVGEEAEMRFKRLFGMPILEAASTGLLLSAKEMMDFYQYDPSELADAIIQFGCDSALLETGFHISKLTSLPGRKSDVLVINGFIPLLQEQFEGVSRSKKQTTGIDNSSNSILSYGDETSDVRVMVWTVRLDESVIPWSVFHSHVIGCADSSRLELQSIRGRLYQTYEDYKHELDYIPKPLTEQGQFSFPAPSFHVSGSEGPLAAIQERMIWLNQHYIADDVFGSKILYTPPKLSHGLSTHGDDGQGVQSSPSLISMSSSGTNLQQRDSKLTSVASHLSSNKSSNQSMVENPLSYQVVEYWLSNPIVKLEGWAAAQVPALPMDFNDKMITRTHLKNDYEQAKRVLFQAKKMLLQNENDPNTGISTTTSTTIRKGYVDDGNNNDDDELNNTEHRNYKKNKKKLSELSMMKNRKEAELKKNIWDAYQVNIEPEELDVLEELFKSQSDGIKTGKNTTISSSPNLSSYKRGTHHQDQSDDMKNKNKTSVIKSPSSSASTQEVLVEAVQKNSDDLKKISENETQVIPVPKEKIESGGDGGDGGGDSSSSSSPPSSSIMLRKAKSSKSTKEKEFIVQSTLYCLKDKLLESSGTLSLQPIKVSGLDYLKYRALPAIFVKWGLGSTSMKSEALNIRNHSRSSTTSSNKNKNNKKAMAMNKVGAIYSTETVQSEYALLTNQGDCDWGASLLNPSSSSSSNQFTGSQEFGISTTTGLAQKLGYDGVVSVEVYASKAKGGRNNEKFIGGAVIPITDIMLKQTSVIEIVKMKKGVQKHRGTLECVLEFASDLQSLPPPPPTSSSTTETQIANPEEETVAKETKENEEENKEEKSLGDGEGKNNTSVENSPTTTSVLPANRKRTGSLTGKRDGTIGRVRLKGDFDLNDDDDVNEQEGGGGIVLNKVSEDTSLNTKTNSLNNDDETDKKKKNKKKNKKAQQQLEEQQEAFDDMALYRFKKDAFLDNMGAALIRCRLIVVRVSPETIRKRLNEVFVHFDVNDRGSVGFEELVEIYATIKLGRGALVVVPSNPSSKGNQSKQKTGLNSRDDTSSPPPPSSSSGAVMNNQPFISNRRASAPTVSALSSSTGLFEDSHLTIGNTNQIEDQTRTTLGSAMNVRCETLFDLTKGMSAGAFHRLMHGGVFPDDTDAAVGLSNRSKRKILLQWGISMDHHPKYDLVIDDGETEQKRSNLRFKAFKDLRSDLGPLPFLNTPFPPVFTKSSFGYTLTSQELSKRFQMLSAWLDDVDLHIDDLSDEQYDTFENFLAGPDGEVDFY